MALVAGYDAHWTAKSGVTETTGDVTGWMDQVTGTREMTVPGTESSPRIGDVALGGAGVISFSSDVLQISDSVERGPSAGNYTYTYMMIRMPTYSSSYEYIFDGAANINTMALWASASNAVVLRDSTAERFFDASAYIDQWVVLTIQWTEVANEVKVFVDGTQIGSNEDFSSLSLDSTGFTLGSREDFFGTGAFDIAEIVEYHDVVQHSQSDIDQNVEHLKQEWGLITTFTLDITSANGTVTKTPDKAEYDDGEQVEIEADADAGYKFDDWTGDVPNAPNATNPLTITMDADKTITANYSQTQLISPEDGATGVSLTPLLDSRDFSGYDFVLFQLSSDSGFASLLIDEIVSVSEYQVLAGILQNSTTYYWRAYGARITFDPTIYNEDFAVADQSGWLDPWVTQNLRANQASFDIVTEQAVMSLTSADTVGVGDLSGIDVDNSIISFKFELNAIVDTFQPSFHFRTTGDWTSEQKTGYWVWFYQGDMYLGTTNSSHSNQVITSVPKTLSANTQYTIKIDLNNTSIRVKVWETAQSEPSSWDIDVISSLHSTGRFSVKAVETAAGTGTKEIIFDDFDISPQSEVPVIDSIDEGDGQLTVHYTGVTSPDSYEYRLDGGAAVDVALDNPFTITGLINGQTYTVEMRAIVGGSPTEWSAPVQATPVAASVTSVTIDQTDFTLSEGQTQQLTVTVESTGGADESVSWSSSDSSVASVDSNGLVTAEADGSAIITATSTFDNTKKDSVTATVEAIAGDTAGDIAALEAFYVATGGSNWTNNTGWASSGMSLSPAPYGVTVENNRVVEIDLRDNNLTGDIDIPELDNLTAIRLFCVYLNNLDSTLPDLSTWVNIEYLYFSGSDDLFDLSAELPHEKADSVPSGTEGGDVHTGKNKGTEQNRFYGAVPSTWNKSNMPNIKWIFLNWTDTSSSQRDGISSVPDEVFDLPTIEGLSFGNNFNIASRTLPATIGNHVEMTYMALNPSQNTDSYWLEGELPAEFSNCVKMRFPRLGGQENLIIDFDVVDFSGMVDLNYLNLPFCDTRGTCPEYLFDGTLPIFNQFTVSWPTGPGLTAGPIPSTINVPLDVFNANNQNFTGAVPADLFDWHIILLGLGYNNLTSWGTQDATSFLQLRKFDFGFNNIEGPVPYMDWGDMSPTSDFMVNGNKLVFSDVLYEPPNGGGQTLYDLVNTEFDRTIRWGNQQPFGSSANESGGVIDFSGIVTHPDNQYQWYRNGSALTGETSNVLDTGSYGSGDYYLDVDNPGAPLVGNIRSVTITI